MCVSQETRFLCSYIFYSSTFYLKHTVLMYRTQNKTIIMRILFFYKNNHKLRILYCKGKSTLPIRQ